jgi:hypothetical protein
MAALRNTTPPPSAQRVVELRQPQQVAGRIGRCADDEHGERDRMLAGDRLPFQTPARWRVPSIVTPSCLGELPRLGLRDGVGPRVGDVRGVDGEVLAGGVLPQLDPGVPVRQVAATSEASPACSSPLGSPTARIAEV